MNGNEIREKFLQYFEKNGHTRVSSASLIPVNDPTLFFVNAGMVPFKDVFIGREKKDYKRAISSQKCLRVSGKHNDLENVGRTPRHHTFFEMLGNFSFGDYFKKEAIRYGWEFLTKEMEIPVEPLWVTIYKDDDEAFDLWRKEVGVPANRIVRCGEKDNFWSVGEIGPCGPCSEIHIDLKQYFGEGEAKGTPATNEDDFMEIWNLVFMQYNRDKKGKMTPLPRPSIDTGMGLERLACVLQKKKSNYETDFFAPIIQFIGDRTNRTYGTNVDDDVSMRVLADHIRAAVFLVSDGIHPSNEGRGYVLRRIMRRAIRHAKMLGKNEPFFYQMVSPLVDMMGSFYHDLKKNKNVIVKVIKTEEKRFLETLENGLEIIEKEVQSLKSKKKKVISGEIAFKLYDTFGFPVDLTQLIAEDKGLTVDMKKFEQEMKNQKEKARASWKGSGQESADEIYHQLSDQKKKARFTGYDMLETTSVVTALIANGKLVKEAKESEKVEVFVNETPFYGEAGGQAGDKGVIFSKGCKIEVKDTLKPLEGIINHQGVVKSGSIKVGDKVKLEVSSSTRRPTMLNHTATHILHAALREILGDHVKQAGSFVDFQRLRFDFNHFEALTVEQIEKIEQRVNEVILAGYSVSKEEMSLKEAKKKGALAFFGEKYGDRVRVVSVGSYSMEFCGGTHLDNSSEIGVFKITSESSVASGVRRIEAVTGMRAFQEFQKLEKYFDSLASILKTTPQELPVKIKKLSEKIRNLEREVTKLKTKVAAGGGGGDYMSQVKEVKGIRLLAFETEVDDPKAMREFSDQVKNRLGSGIAVIGSKVGGRVSLIVTVSPDLIKKYHAGKIIGEIAKIVGGKGGGRPDMAQAGGKDPEKLEEALKKVEKLI